ncbi:PRC and DUF2382 domain-containing protein [Streptomyces sp. NPDC049837]|uniref:PRC and DUF2382 domain-containing protein n=1 Tax=Streptomyces sp. NPDC049837 TaxID=3155277 RepID=UPI0034137BFD
MINRTQIPAVLDHPVYDATGDKIGEAKHVFVDDVTGRPDWVSVRTGFFGTSESFVPIHDAALVEDHLEVPYPKGKVKDAPNVDVDAGGHLSAAEERRLYDYYGLRWDGTLGRGDLSGDGGRAGTGTAAAAGTAGTRAGDDAMTRSEEEMHVGVEQRETGKARLRKYIVTEEVQQTIPLRHEEVTLEREPVTEANRDAALSGPEISESEHEVTLHAEQPVVGKETKPVERVRLRTDEVTDEETVRGQVRKERIEADLPDKETGKDRDR